VEPLSGGPVLSLRGMRGMGNSRESPNARLTRRVRSDQESCERAVFSQNSEREFRSRTFAVAIGSTYGSAL
jgi:hypothetical protein